MALDVFYTLLTAGEALSVSSSIALIVASFFTSLITATLGIGVAYCYWQYWLLRYR